MLVLVIAAATIKSPSFLFSANSWRDLLLTPSILLLLAAGQCVVIITRNVDLSVGSILGLTAYLTGRLFIDTGLPVVAVVLCGVLVGALLGAVNGLLVGFGKVPSLVITLGTLYIYRGAVLSWAGSNRINASDLPDSFGNLGTQTHRLDPDPLPGRARRRPGRGLLPLHQPRWPRALRHRLGSRTPPSCTDWARAAGW